MTAPTDESDRQIADDVLPESITDLAVPVQLDRLAPWHRPRKQLVRERQWLALSRGLIQKERGGPGLPEPSIGKPEVRYLTLPGTDYLDVRQLADVCHELDCRLTSTGFQSGGEGNPLVARAQMREKSLIDAGYINDSSHTYPRRFEEIAHATSSAYRDLRSRGPFHIVNIDACGSIAPPSADHAQRIIDALYRTVELQLELKTGRWLLLVTADAQPDSIAKATLNRLCDAIFSNAEQSEDFRCRAGDLFGTPELDIRTAVERAAQSVGEGFLRLFSLGIAKWLLALAREGQWDMKTHRPYCYSTLPRSDETPSMACLAFEFLPPAPGLSDPLAVTRAQPRSMADREDMSLRAAHLIGQMENADSRLSGDESLRIRMTDNLRRLLGEVPYHPATLEKIGS